MGFGARDFVHGVNAAKPKKLRSWEADASEIHLFFKRINKYIYERCHLFQVKETSRYFLRSAYRPGKIAKSLVNEGVRVTAARVTAAKDMAAGVIAARVTAARVTAAKDTAVRGFSYIQTPGRLPLAAITGN